MWSFLRDLERWQDVVQWFMPSWFTVCMGTGILASNIGRISYDIYPLRILGLTIFVFNIVLLVLFFTLQIAQLIVYPGIIEFMRRNPRRMLHYGAIPMALGTVLTGISEFQIYEMNHAVVYIAWSIWWISVVLAAAASVLLICLIVSRETRSIESVTGAWLLLVAPLAVCASTGASIADYLPTDLAYITLIVSYALLGSGAPLTCCILVLYVTRITTFKLPPHDAIVTSFIPLGPAGQIGVAALSLGRIANAVLLDSTPQLDILGPTMLGAGVLIALMSWGFCVFLLTHAVFSVVYQRRSAVIPFNISWWSLTFPIGVFGSLTAGLGEVLDMRYLQVNFMVMVVLLLVLWMFNMVRTIAGAWTGSIFGIPSLANKEDATKESTSSAVTICDSRPTDRYV